MALSFSATTHRVDHGNASSINFLRTFTGLAWVYRTTNSGYRGIMGKGTLANATRRDMSTYVNHSDVELYVSRVTTAADARSNTGIVPLNAWKFLAWTFEEADGPRIFHGNLSTIAAEITYNTRTVGVGDSKDDSADTLKVGNIGTTDYGWPGRIGVFLLFNRQMGLAEIQSYQFFPRVGDGCVLFTHLGYNGTGTQPDWSGSGNAGTVTGATVVDHLPLGPLFGVARPWAPTGTPRPPALWYPSVSYYGTGMREVHA